MNTKCKDSGKQLIRHLTCSCTWPFNYLEEKNFENQKILMNITLFGIQYRFPNGPRFFLALIVFDLYSFEINKENTQKT